MQNYLRYRYKDHIIHMQSVTFYTFPRLVMDDQYYPKTIACRQCIKACGRPDHQLNMEMIIKDIVKRKHYYRICHKGSDRKLTFCEHDVNMPELRLHLPDTTW